MIKILHELSALDGGGVAKLILDYYTYMDKSRLHFDFLIYDFYDEGVYEKVLADMGCKIHKIPIFKTDRFACLKQMKKIIEDNNYDIIHSHLGSRGIFSLHYAKKFNVEKRIAHSHIANEPVSKLKYMINKLASKYVKHLATDLFACGDDAGKYMWGKNEKIHIMTNAIDTDKFKFSKETREKLRREFALEDKFVIGMVGRLCEQKNYPYIFKVLKEILKEKENIVLLVVGRGLEEENIKNSAKDIGVYNNVRFLGIRNDVQRLINVFDVFVLPSLYEGLPIVLVEAQTSGVSQIVSEKVTREIDIAGITSYLPIGDENIIDWKEAVLECESQIRNRENYSEIVKGCGYDIVLQSKKLEELYLSL